MAAMARSTSLHPARAHRTLLLGLALSVALLATTLPTAAAAGAETEPAARGFGTLLRPLLPSTGQLTAEAALQVLADDRTQHSPSPSPRHRHLLAGNYYNKTSNATCNCGQLPQLNILQIIDFCGALPIVRQYTHQFKEEIEAQGNVLSVQTYVQHFNSPSDLTPLAGLEPNNNFITQERRMAAIGPVLSPPAWVLQQQQQPSPTAVDAKALRTALSALVKEGVGLFQNQVVMLVYRRDVLANWSLPVPETWDQMLQIAAKVNGSDLNGDGVGDYALCVDVDPDCKMYWLFSAVAASMLQVNGTSTGYLLDPVTGQYLLHSEGMLAALRLWAQLMQYNSPKQSEQEYCGVFEDVFTDGGCLFTLSLQQINSNNVYSGEESSASYSWGRTGHAPTPGSTTVYDRASGTMVPCTRTTCPLAAPLSTSALSPSGGAQQYVNRAPVMSRIDNGFQNGHGAANTAQAMEVYGANWNTVCGIWLYFAFNPLAFTSTITTFSSIGVNFTAMDFSAVNATYYNSSQFVLDVYAWVDSVRSDKAWSSPSAISSSAYPSVPWLGLALALSLEQGETYQYMRTSVWAAVHPNVVQDPQMVSPLRITVASAARQILQGVNESLILTDIDHKLWLWGMMPSSYWSKEGYNADVGYAVPPPPAPPSPPALTAPSDDSGLSGGQLALVIAGPVALLLLLALALVMVGTLRSRAGFDLFGKVRAPGLGPSTSLLVTDIQNSTSLWELLPEGVMNEAVQLHHQVMRGLLRQHKGYETCTEGDSFIIAFHSPSDALRYCLAVQSALLTALWPGQLLGGNGSAEVQLQYKPEAMKWCDPCPPSISFWQPTSHLGAYRPKTWLQRSAFSRIWPACRPSSPGSLQHALTTFSMGGAEDSRRSQDRSSHGGVEDSMRTEHEMEGSGRGGRGGKDASGQLSDKATGEMLHTWLRSNVQVVSSCIEESLDLESEGLTSTAFRGLRVRMGLHAGLVDPREWCINQATGRMCASGPFLAACKVIADAGAGGMIVLSKSFWAALLPFGTPPDCVVLHMGEHELKDQEGNTALYLALPKPLVCRLAMFPPLRSLGLTSPSLLSAPVGQATVVFMHAVGVGALRAWDAQLTKEALNIYHETVSRALLEWDGYLMELVDGLCLASFADPGAAVSWALRAQADLLTQDWDPRLLRHELCEEVAVRMHSSTSKAKGEAADAFAVVTPFSEPAGVGPYCANPFSVGPSAVSASARSARGTSFYQAGGAAVPKQILMRGLRVKAGIAMGPVNCSINPTTGRMAYMGKVMNRAARIAGYATSSQVLCSADAWAASCQSTASRAVGALQGLFPSVMGTSLGPLALKGVSQKLEVFHCTLEE